MRNNAIGDGRETCLLCNSKFAALKVIAKRCDICGKVYKPVLQMFLILFNYKQYYDDILSM